MIRLIALGGALALTSCADVPELGSSRADSLGADETARDTQVPIASFGPRPLPDDIQALIVSDEPLPDPVPLPLAVELLPTPHEAYVSDIASAQVSLVIARITDLSHDIRIGQTATVEVLLSDTANIAPHFDAIIPNGASCQGARGISLGETVLLHIKNHDIERTHSAPVWIYAPQLAAVAQVLADPDAADGFVVRYPWETIDFGSIASEVRGIR